MSAPKGWTWPKVAQKRALRNALALSHGKPTAGELRQAAEQVHRESPQGRLEVLQEQVAQITAQAEALTVEQHKERRQRNVAIMRGEEEPGIDDDPVVAETEQVLAMAREEEPAKEEQAEVIEAADLQEALEVLEGMEPAEAQPQAGQLELPEGGGE